MSQRAPDQKPQLKTCGNLATKPRKTTRKTTKKSNKVKKKSLRELRELSNKVVISRGGFKKLLCYKEEPVRFVFWTGGYDSTFRLLQLLIIQRRPAVAVYISDPTTDSRANVRFELRCMRTIIAKVKKRFPFTKNLLKDFIVIKEVPQRSGRLDKTFRALQKEYKEFYRRHVDGRIYYGQMEKLAIISKRMRRVFDLGVIRNERDQEVYRNEHLMRYKSDRCTFTNKIPNLYRAFCWLRFPIAHITKEEMLIIAHQHYFSDILLFNTLSCRWCKFERRKINTVVGANAANTVSNATECCGDLYNKGLTVCRKCHMCKLRKKCFANLLNILKRGYYSQKQRYKPYFTLVETLQPSTTGISTIRPTGDAEFDDKAFKTVRSKKLSIPDKVQSFLVGEITPPFPNSLSYLENMIRTHIQMLYAKKTKTKKTKQRSQH